MTGRALLYLATILRHAGIAMTGSAEGNEITFFWYNLKRRKNHV